MPERKAGSDWQTHDEIIRPVRERGVLETIADAKAGQERAKELAPDPEVGWVSYAPR